MKTIREYRFESLKVEVVSAHENGISLNDFNSKLVYQRQVSDVYYESKGLGKVYRSQDGVPFIAAEGIEISISHCGDLFAYASSNKVVGVDIEIMNRDLQKHRSYFMSDNDCLPEEMTNELWYVCWCAKEALYKLLHGKVPNYSKGLIIKQIDAATRTLKIAHEKREYEGRFEIFDGHSLVWIA